MTDDEANAVAKSLSDEAIVVGYGWFSFGAKAAVISNPPHENMNARKASLDELLAAELITHEHQFNKRHKIDRHHFRGTPGIGAVLRSEHGKSVLRAALETRDASS